MQNHAGRLAVIGLGLVVFWACAESSDAGPTLDELPVVLVDAICPEVEACLGEELAESYFGDGGCAERLRAQIDDRDFSATQEAVAEGRVRYDGSKVDACLAQLQGVGCGYQTMRALTNEACDEVLEGMVEIGGECALDEDCAGVAFCDRSGNRCPGTCTVLLGVGETCESDDQCDDGLTCPSSTRRCSVPADRGASCGDSAGGAECGAGLACVTINPGQERTQVCRPLDELYVLELGETCRPDDGTFCKQELVCLAVNITATGASFACAERVDSGEECVFGFPNPCPEDEHCAGIDLTGPVADFDGTCEPLPEAGEACSTAGGQPCADGLLCDTDERCHPVSRLGQPCVSDKGCASGRCDGGECVRPEGCALSSTASE